MQSIPFQFSHGGYIKQEAVENAVADTDLEAIDVETDFGYLFPKRARDPKSLLSADNPSEMIVKLKALGDAMIDAVETPADPQAANSKIPPVYTYWGQFIDHDITANTDRASADLETDITKDDFAPLAPNLVVQKLKNLRRPTLDLDSVYGDGPTLDPDFPTEAKDFYQADDPVKLKIGVNTEKNVPVPPFRKVPPENDLNRDLPRQGEAGKSDDPNTDTSRLAVIGDSRNDENLIVAQLHVAFLRFHNAVVDWVRKHEPENATDNQTLFVRAQNLVRWHYQWLVVNDFLKTLTVQGTVEDIVNKGLKFYKLGNRPIFMPLEFSVAAYRFGHSMVRAAYDFNLNFTDEATDKDSVTDATFELLFSFTGRAKIGERNGPGANDTLPFNWIIDWDRFVSKDKAALRQRNSARKIDTHLAPPLGDLLNEAEDQPQPPVDIKALLKHLAKRNLLRGYLLSLPTGQSIAKRMGVKPLSPEELKKNNSDAMNQALAPFLEKTPIWFYVLKEAEVRANGDSLGAVGSRIVAETLIALLMHDSSSYLHQHENDLRWRPSNGVKLPDGSKIHTIGDLLKFAGVKP